MLHAFAGALPDAMSLSARDAILPVVPMFHVNAWGMPYFGRADGRQAGVSRARQWTASRSYELIEAEKRDLSPRACPPCGRCCWAT